MYAWNETLAGNLFLAFFFTRPFEILRKIATMINAKEKKNYSEGKPLVIDAEPMQIKKAVIRIES